MTGEKAPASGASEGFVLTTDLVRRSGVVAVEKLRIANMTRSAAGTVEAPGKHVAAKSGLHRSISEQTWGLVRSQLAYKAAWAGRQLRCNWPSVQAPKRWGNGLHPEEPVSPTTAHRC